ncbi:hypothetical protein V8D89_009410, partial [Ganoderma adspersum]
MREHILGPAIMELTAPDAADADKPTKIEGFHCISSYTWEKNRNPTLIVPGSPREWLNRALPFQVSFDSGIRMFHEDAYYMANESTLIPLFRAVDTMAPATGSEPTAGAIDWAAVDFVTDRNNLRKLLRWVREPGPTIQVPSPTSEVSPTSLTSDASESKQGSEVGAALEWGPRKDFRIDLQLAGTNTVLMERWAARTREVIAPPKGGCRANFEREHTAAGKGCENGGGHYRIVQYNIGGLKMIVRFEVDACIAAMTVAAAEGVQHPERDTDVVDVATPGDAGLGIETSKDTESPARQSFAAKDEGALSKGGTELNPKKHETEEVDFDKEAELWAGGGDDSWGPLPEPRQASKSGRVDGKGKEDIAPSPQDLTWDFPEDDGAAWGVTTDMAQNEDSEVNGELTVIQSGTLLPQSILELATRSIRFVDRTSNEDTFL